MPPTTRRTLLNLPLVLIAVYLGLEPDTFIKDPDQAGAAPPLATLPASQQSANTTLESGNATIAQAFANRQSNVQAELVGKVSRILSDDNDGSRHQRFIVSLDNGLTVLVAHNIDLAPRVEGLRQGDTVQVYGEYEYNNQGGVMHWTHHDPAGRHEAGWIKLGSQIYK